MAMNRRGSRVDSAIDDLTKAVELSADNVNAFCMLGECYEIKKMKAMTQQINSTSDHVYIKRM